MPRNDINEEKRLIFKIWICPVGGVNFIEIKEEEKNMLAKLLIICLTKRKMGIYIT